MEYLSSYQIILLLFLAATHIVGFFFFLFLVQPEDEAKMLLLTFYLWCIYAVLSLGVYFYLGTINY